MESADHHGRFSIFRSSVLKSDKSVGRPGNCQYIINKCKSVRSLEEFYHQCWSITSSRGGVFDVAMLGCRSYSNLSSQYRRHPNYTTEMLVVSRPTILTLLPGACWVPVAGKYLGYFYKIQYWSDLTITIRLCHDKCYFSVKYWKYLYFNPAFSVIFIQHFGYFGNIEVHLNVWTLYNNQW